MNIFPITPTTPACYGVLCPQRKECQRYHLVESTSMAKTISTCAGADGERPHFVAVAALPKAAA